MEKKYGKDIHEQGKITILASSTTKNKPEKVIDYETNDDWFSNGNPDNWIEFNFKNQKVKINGYSIKTYNNATNWHHLKNWIIEGSNNRNQWMEIDKKENNSDLNGRNYQCFFPISRRGDEFQYIRLRMIGTNHHGDYYEIDNVFSTPKNVPLF